MFKYSNTNKRYYTLDYFYKKKFNSKVFKVSLNAGFTCPNKDGKVGLGGCIYCSKTGSGEYAGDIKKDLNTKFVQNYFADTAFYIADKSDSKELTQLLNEINRICFQAQKNRWDNAIKNKITLYNVKYWIKLLKKQTSW